MIFRAFRCEDTPEMADFNADAGTGSVERRSMRC
jgi:hypothetical protein